jgi:hypothetical protein
MYLLSTSSRPHKPAPKTSVGHQLYSSEARWDSSQLWFAHVGPHYRLTRSFGAPRGIELAIG